jgi:sodium/bile acid cotransporter 7
MLARLIPDRFLLALIAVIVAASLLPARGLGAAIVGDLATAAIALLFFFHGAKLPREAVVAAIGHWRLHLLILASSFVLFPLIGLALATAVPGLLSPALWAGMLFLCVLPSTVQSSIAFTSIAGGNVAGAVAAASASNILGIAITPLLAGLLTSSHGGAVPLAGIGGIVATILLPFVIGHALRPWIGGLVDRWRWLIGYSDRATILIAVYSAFSAAVVAGLWARVAGEDIARLLIACALLLALILAATRAAARMLGFDRPDEIAIIFCGSKKSMVTGIPMARVLFSGPDVGTIVLPLMLFHQMQLMACAYIARRYALTTVAHRS